MFTFTRSNPMFNRLHSKSERTISLPGLCDTRLGRARRQPGLNIHTNCRVF